MGTGASVHQERSLTRLIERDCQRQIDHDKSLFKQQLDHEEEVSKLTTAVSELTEQLRAAKLALESCQKKLNAERKRNISITYCNLPFMIMKETSVSQQCTRKYPMITVAHCDVVNFPSMASDLPPGDTVNVINQLQAAIDRSFVDDNVYIMERHDDGCIAVSGLVDYDDVTSATTPRKKLVTPDSFGYASQDSPYGFEYEHSNSNERFNDETEPAAPNNSPSSLASILALSVLRLMSLSSHIHIPSQKNKHLQLRIAMNSGPCNSGIVDLPTSTGSTQVPHFRLFGHTINEAKRLCSTGLALQIRVSKQCYQLLLVDEHGFRFERCPDFIDTASGNTVESYWLTGADSFSYQSPSLDSAISLSSYDDIS